MFLLGGLNICVFNYIALADTPVSSHYHDCPYELSHDIIIISFSSSLCVELYSDSSSDLSVTLRLLTDAYQFTADYNCIIKISAEYP